MDVKETVPELRELLGARIRQARKDNNLSVRSLAEAAGVSSAMISQIENGHVMPSVATLVGIASAVDIKVGELFEAAPTAHQILRVKDRVPFETSPGVTDVILSVDPKNQLEVVIGYIEPGQGSGEDLYSHGAETEFVLVLRGEIEILLGDDVAELKEGDSLTFSGDIPHGYVNRTDQLAEILWVMTPATY